MEQPTTIRPAKRILVLYMLAFIAVLIVLIVGLENLQSRFGLEDVLMRTVWKMALLIGLSSLGYSFLWRLTSVFTISTECVTATVGILSKKHIRIPMNRIVDYRVTTPLHERVLGLGSIHIDTAGDDDLVMWQVSQPEIDLALIRLDKTLNKAQLKVYSAAG